MTLEQLPLIMLRALILTLIIECITAWCLGIRSKQDQLVVALANLMTNPVVVAIGAAAAFFIGHGIVLPITIVMEIAVVLIEGVIYSNKLATAKNPYALSLLCNMASYGIGEILNRFIF